MNDKQQCLTSLKEEFERWEELLSTLSEAQLTDRNLPDDQSINDVMAHLMAWQQVGIARLEAALHNREPAFPPAPPEFDLGAEKDVDGINVWFYESYRNQPWSSVYSRWREGFLRFIELGEAIPESDLLDAQRYPWMRGYSLADGLQSSFEYHHDDHFEPLLAWLKQHGHVSSTE